MRHCTIQQQGFDCYAITTATYLKDKVFFQGRLAQINNMSEGTLSKMMQSIHIIAAYHKEHNTVADNTVHLIKVIRNLLGTSLTASRTIQLAIMPLHEGVEPAKVEVFCTGERIV